MVRDFGKVMYMLLSLKWITSKDLRTAQGTLFKVMWQPGWGGAVWGRVDTYVSMAESLRCSSETTRTSLISCTPVQSKKFKAEKKKPSFSLYHSLGL